jgi:argininosuccinate lyase
LAEVLSPEYFVRIRSTPGGPAPSETVKAIAQSRACLARDEEWIRTKLQKLRAAEERLKAAAAEL